MGHSSLNVSLSYLRGLEVVRKQTIKATKRDRRTKDDIKNVN